MRSITMCTGAEGRELQRVFAYYYNGALVRNEDLGALNVLRSTDYVEYYMSNGAIYARAGPVGRKFRMPAGSSVPS